MSAQQQIAQRPPALRRTRRRLDPDPLARLEVSCRGCRSGLVSTEHWDSWYARADELEAEHGTLDGSAIAALLDERPDQPQEAECTGCDGTGAALTDTGREVLAWARRRLDDRAA